MVVIISRRSARPFVKQPRIPTTDVSQTSLRNGEISYFIVEIFVLKLSVSQPTRIRTTALPRGTLQKYSCLLSQPPRICTTAPPWGTFQTGVLTRWMKPGSIFVEGCLRLGQRK